MSKTTTNFGFIKPELTDSADITQTNPNWDKVDSELKNVNDRVNSLSTDSSNHENNTNNPHKVTAEQVGAAKSTHNHSASDINSGTLDIDRLPTVPVANGGTGANTVEKARTNLGVVSSFYTPDLYVWHKTANSLDGYSYDDVVNCNIGLFVAGTTAIYYSSEFEIVNNVVHLVNPVRLSGKTSDVFEPIIGKFVTKVIGGGTSGDVYKIPVDATLSVGTNGLTVDRAQKLPHTLIPVFL